MKKRLGAILVLVVFSMLALAGCSMGNKIGKVDMQKVMNDSQFAKDIKQELQTKEKDLTAGLENDQKNMSQEDFQKKMQTAQADFMKANQDAKARFDAAMKTAIEKVQKDKGVDVVVYADAIAQGGVDITDEVLKAMPQTVANPANTTPAPAAAPAPAAPAPAPEKK